MADRARALDPRTKLALAIAFSAVLIVTTRPVVLIGASVAMIFLVLVLALGHAWLKMLRVLVPMTIFFILVMLYAFDTATALEGALRLVAMTSAFFVFFQTTAPEDLANSLVKSGVPYSFAFILSTAMQFIPVLSDKMNDIMDAQRARGIRLERDLASLRNYPALFAPLLIESFTLADQLAEAMEARGFGSPYRTFARAYTFRALDYALWLLAAGILLIGWFFK